MTTKTPWLPLAITTLPILGFAVIVSATFGPAGAIAYGALLLAGVNVRHLFIDRKRDRP